MKTRISVILGNSRSIGVVLLAASILIIEATLSAKRSPALTRVDSLFIQVQCFVPALETTYMNAVSVSLSTAKIARPSSHVFS